MKGWFICTSLSIFYSNSKQLSYIINKQFVNYNR
jgi:hypothetical protein